MLTLNRIRDLLARHGHHLDHVVPSFSVGGVQFDFERERYLCGVINLSEDSWYEESVCRTTEEAVRRGSMLAAQGATIVDIGAESTLPNAERVSPEAQLERLLPTVERLSDAGILVSVESYHPVVLERCAEAGARIFNLTGVQAAREVFELAGRYDAAVILCYVQGAHVRSVGDFTFFSDMVPELLRYFRALTDQAREVGLDRCFIDPGLGFYYRNLDDGHIRVTHQLETFLNCFRLYALGYPTFNILPHAPEAFGDSERRSAEPFFAVPAILGGTHVIRTHEVDRVRRVLSALRMHRAGTAS